MRSRTERGRHAVSVEFSLQRALPAFSLSCHVQAPFSDMRRLTLADASPGGVQYPIAHVTHTPRCLSLPRFIVDAVITRLVLPDHCLPQIHTLALECPRLTEFTLGQSALSSLFLFSLHSTV